MKHFKRFFAAFLVAFLLVSLSACAPNLAVAAVTPTPEVTTAPPTATPEPTATPVPTLCPEPTEVPTPAVDEYGFTEERKAELNHQIQDFLSYQGEFTREKMSEMMMNTMTDLNPSEVGLGIVDTQPQIQGYFFDYFVKDNRIILLMGFDGKDGNRFVTPVEIPTYCYEEGSEKIAFLFLKYKVNNLNGIDNSDNSSVDVNGTVTRSPDGNIESILANNEDKIVAQLDDLKNRTIVLFLFGETQDPYSFSDIDHNSSYVINFFEEVNSRVGLSLGLFQMVLSNEISYESFEEGDTSSILKIDNTNNIGTIDITKVPALMIISYFTGME